MNEPDSRYWDQIAVESARGIDAPLWRAYCDQLHSGLIRDWTEGCHFHSALKTDLFEEAMGCGLVPLLLEQAGLVQGIDLAAEVVHKAAVANPRLLASVGDVRQLGFSNGSIEWIVSNSTLDHFPDAGDIDRSLAELARVLAPGGLLLVTLDNPQNPVVALRNRLPKTLLGRTALAPYFVGHTYSLDQLEEALRRQGLQIVRQKHLMHVPRIVFLHLCRLFQPHSIAGRILLRWMLAWEWLDRWPTAPFSGHFAAVLARKPGPDEVRIQPGTQEV
jgi:SAM-dependent methyltransferase